MKSNVNVRKHPVHPYLVLLVVAVLVASLVFDLAYLATGTIEWRFAAFYTILFGVIMGLIAGVVGLIDLLTLRMQERARGIGWTHGLLNAGIVILYIINLIVRGDPSGAAFGNPLGWTITLNVVSVFALLFSIWLGQVLVYRWGVAIPVDTIEFIPPVARPAPQWVTPQVAGAKGGEYPTKEEMEEEERHGGEPERRA